MIENIIVNEKDIVGVPKESGIPEICHIEYPRPLPCIVILIHGVNDIGEAYPNLDKGICAGLNKRLGRNDLKPNKWQVIQNTLNNCAPRMEMLTQWEELVGDITPPLKPNIVKHKGNSPIIPFYWGYKPVDIETYYQEQRAYEQRLKKDDEPELPYDSYWQENETGELIDLVKFTKLNCDKFGNWIDNYFCRNGGPFSDATTCIPDMYGPGLSGATNWFGKKGSDSGAKIYENPHRIYMVYAAQRLADLIIKIRGNENLKEAPINIIAHSQGTLITMLANMIIADNQKDDGEDSLGYLPADCIILANSPYAFESTYLETQSKESGMGVQTADAREQTFIHFVEIMKEKQLQRVIKWDDVNQLIDKGIACHVSGTDLLDPLKQHYDFTNPLYCRNNFGKVYNYFSPNDQVVSLRSVEGMGWQGIPNHIFERCGSNLKQRVFSHRFIVGDDPDKLTCYRPAGSFVIPVPDYINRQAIVQRMTSLTQSLQSSESYELTDIYLNDQELALINHHNPMQNGRFVSGSYNIKSDKLSIYYIAHGEIVSKINEDKANNSYSPFETGSISNARYSSREQLKINGEQVPLPITYLAGQSSSKNTLAKAIHYGDLYQLYQTRYARVRAEPYPPTILIYNESDTPREPLLSENAYNIREVVKKSWLEKVKAQHPEWGEVLWIAYTDDPHKFLVYKSRTDEDIKSIIKDEWQRDVNKVEDNSHHSAITMSDTVPSHIMAYDLALGEAKNHTKEHKYFWQQLIYLADWRAPENDDEGVVRYFDTGILPKPIKEKMNKAKGNLPSRVINDFEHVATIVESVGFGLAKGAASIYKPAKPLGGFVIRTVENAWKGRLDPNQQWPYPEPDIKKEPK